MTILVLVTLFPSYVKADVQLSQEFVEPIKNWSFEEIEEGALAPCALQDWSTNNGGWREPRSDVNQDGKVSVADVAKVDIDFSGLRFWPSPIDGIHSWYTSGGGVVDGYEDYSESIYPSDDSYVCEDDPDSIYDSKVPEGLAVYYWSGYRGRVWLKFTVPSGYQVTKAEVRLYQSEYSHFGDPTVSIHYSTDNSWSEETITWNNQPTFGGALDSKVVSNPYHWFSWDVSSVISSSGTFSFCLKTETIDSAACFWSKEHDGLDPYLYIEYSRPAYSYVMSQVLDSDTIIKGKQVTFAFWFLPETVASDGKQNYARAEIYYEYSGGSNTVCGTWIAPTELNWWNAYVTASLPSTTTTVKVNIHGKPDFKAWVDFAELTIMDQAQKTSDYGDVTLAVATYYWFKKSVQPDGEVWFVPALHAESAAGYGIIGTKLKIELLPPPGTSTPQEGFLHIYYCHQGNEEGYEINPEATEEKQARLLTVGGWAITIGTAIATGYGVGFLLAGSQYLGIFKVFAGTAGARGAVALLHMLASDPNVKDSQEAGKNYVLEYWGDYPTFSHEYHPTPFVDIADASANVQWLFNSASADTFTIKITASVWWGQKNYYPGHYDGSHWELDSVGWTHAVTYMTVNA